MSIAKFFLPLHRDDGWDRGKVTHGADKAADDEEAVSALRDELEEKDKIISGLRKEMEELSARNEELLTVIRKIGTMVEGI